MYLYYVKYVTLLTVSLYMVYSYFVLLTIKQ